MVCRARCIGDSGTASPGRWLCRVARPGERSLLPVLAVSGVAACRPGGRLSGRPTFRCWCIGGSLASASGVSNISGANDPVGAKLGANCGRLKAASGHIELRSPQLIGLQSDIQPCPATGWACMVCKRSDWSVIERSDNTTRCCYADQLRSAAITVRSAQSGFGRETCGARPRPHSGAPRFPRSWKHRCGRGAPASQTAGP
jgi:hypothetical protein